MSLNSAYRKVNESIATRAVLLFGTMETAYALFLFVLLPLFIPNIQILVLYISSTIIQLVALPLIMVDGKLRGYAQEIRAQQDHEAIMEELRDIRAIYEVVVLQHTKPDTSQTSFGK